MEFRRTKNHQIIEANYLPICLELSVYIAFFLSLNYLFKLNAHGSRSRFYCDLLLVIFKIIESKLFKFIDGLTKYL